MTVIETGDRKYALLEFAAWKIYLMVITHCSVGLFLAFYILNKTETWPTPRVKNILSIFLAAAKVWRELQCALYRIASEGGLEIQLGPDSSNQVTIVYFAYSVLTPLTANMVGKLKKSASLDIESPSGQEWSHLKNILHQYQPIHSFKIIKWGPWARL